MYRSVFGRNRSGKKQAVCHGGDDRPVTRRGRLGQAAFQGVAGEALLIPFVLCDTKNGIDTVINVTVPDKVGQASVPNLYTAPHTSPRDDSLPDAPVHAHWMLVDADGILQRDWRFDVRPRQLYSFRLTNLLSSGDVALDGMALSLLLLTDAGFNGDQADFNLMANASMSLGNTSDVTDLPVFAMADGEDSRPLLPSPGNEVIEATHPFPMVSPLAAGISTGTGTSPEQPVRSAGFALKLHQQPAGRWGFLYDHHTLLVVWNDRKYPGGSDVWPYTVRNDQGNACTGTLEVKRRLNLYWVSIRPQPLSVSPVKTFSNVLLCDPSPSGRPAYVEIQVPPVADAHAASVAFSVISNRVRFFWGPTLSTSIASEQGMTLVPR